MFSKPKVLEMIRGSPNVVHGESIYPFILIKTAFFTGYFTNPVMEVWCITNQFERPDPTYVFPDAIKDCMKYLLAIMVKDPCSYVHLSDDVLTKIMIYLDKEDKQSLALTSKRFFMAVSGTKPSYELYRYSCFSNIEAKYISQFSLPPIFFTKNTVHSLITWRNFCCFYNGKNPFDRPELANVRRSAENFTKRSAKLRIINHIVPSVKVSDENIPRRLSKKNIYEFKEISANAQFGECTKETYYTGLKREPDGTTAIMKYENSSVPGDTIERRMIDHDYDVDNYDGPLDDPSHLIFRSPMVIDTKEQREWIFHRKKRPRHS